MAAGFILRLQDKLIDQQDIVNSLGETAEMFNQGALQLLDNCYKTDDTKTTQLLKAEFQQFKVCLDFMVPRNL